MSSTRNPGNLQRIALYITYNIARNTKTDNFRTSVWEHVTHVYIRNDIARLTISEFS